MHADLDRIFQQLENERNQVLAEIEKMPPARYTFSTGKKWSIAQILTHLLTSEKLSIRYMKKKSLGMSNLQNSGLIDELRYSLLKISQRISFLKYRAPTVVVENTPSALPFHELKREWQSLRQELRIFLESIEDKNVSKKIFKHPVAGRLNVKQAIGFFGEHFNHHLPQIKRLLQ
jgi:hypothetical protein